MTPLQMFRTLVASCILAMAFTAHAQPGVGSQSPDNLGVDQKGEAVLVSAFAGKVRVITFWATWCPYCIKELPVLHNIQNKIGRDRLQVIAVNTEDREVFRRVMKLVGPLNMLHSWDGERRSQDAYGVKGIPHLVIVGRDGNIVAVYRGYDEASLPGITAHINRALASTNE